MAIWCQQSSLSSPVDAVRQLQHECSCSTATPHVLFTDIWPLVMTQRRHQVSSASRCERVCSFCSRSPDCPADDWGDTQLQGHPSIIRCLVNHVLQAVLYGLDGFLLTWQLMHAPCGCLCSPIAYWVCHLSGLHQACGPCRISLRELFERLKLGDQYVIGLKQAQHKHTKARDSCSWQPGLSSLECVTSDSRDSLVLNYQ